jgi:UDP-N-acetylglucosamine--N-acetylmuramyl-(pentapeptide) pyrophosphoryl-undecaprenol N-acetylglucosamine transferase
MRNLKSHVLFAGGGTAGHLFPGLAVAEYLRNHAPHVRISFAGTGKAFESRYIEKAGFAYLQLPSRPFPQKATEALRFVTENVAGYYAARKYLREQQVGLVVGLGGYASVPAARAAAAAGIPYLLLEQNAIPGRATRWLAPGATVICSAFEGIRSRLKKSARVRVTGNPLRKPFTAQATQQRNLPDRLGGRRTLLVMGGSGGAQTLNEQVPRALYKAGAVLHGWNVVHQTGERDVTRTAELYRKLGIAATVAPFIDELPQLMRDSQLAICRAGGTTLAELAASGLPAVVLPFPAATDDHQRENAEVFAAAGACRMVDEREVEGRLDNQLAQLAIELAADHRQRVRMAQAMTALARPQATRRVARSIAALLESRQLVVA